MKLITLVPWIILLISHVTLAWKHIISKKKKLAKKQITRVGTFDFITITKKIV